MSESCWMQMMGPTSSFTSLHASVYLCFVIVSLRCNKDDGAHAFCHDVHSGTTV